MGVERKGDKENLFDIEESLEELGQLADTAGLMVVGSTYQKWVFCYCISEHFIGVATKMETL